MSYIERKLRSKAYASYFNALVDRLEGKKILVYGVGEIYKNIARIVDLSRLRVVAMSDIEFVEMGELWGINTVPPKYIPELDIDVILVCAQHYKKVEKFLYDEALVVDGVTLEFALPELVDKEYMYVHHLKHWHFDESLKRLTRRMGGKRVAIYGVGGLFETIMIYHDLSPLNVVCISDKRFNNEQDVRYMYGYEVCSPSKILERGIECVLVSTMSLYPVMMELDKELCGAGVDVMPLVTRGFWDVLKEIWK